MFSLKSKILAICMIFSTNHASVSVRPFTVEPDSNSVMSLVISRKFLERTDVPKFEDVLSFAKSGYEKIAGSKVSTRENDLIFPIVDITAFNNIYREFQRQCIDQKTYLKPFSEASFEHFKTVYEFLKKDCFSREFICQKDEVKGIEVSSFLEGVRDSATCGTFHRYLDAETAKILILSTHPSIDPSGSGPIVFTAVDKYNDTLFNNAYMCILYPKVEFIDLRLRECEKYFHEILSSAPSFDSIMRFYTYFVQTSPFQQGSERIAQWMRDALLHVKGFPMITDRIIHESISVALRSINTGVRCDLYKEISDKPLKLVMRQYFNEQFYRSQTEAIVGDAFEHFLKYGKDKRPSIDFDNQFVENVNASLLLKELHPHYLEFFAKSKLNGYNVLKQKSDQLPVSLLEKPKYYLAIVAIFRNEARFLKEWVEYYLMQGVEHFYLFNHRSTDEFLDVLKPYITDGIIDLVTLERDTKNTTEWYALQCGVYTQIAQQVSQDVEWLFPVDTDEFLETRVEGNIPDILRKNYDDVACLSVNWQMFGTSRVRRLADDQLLTEMMIRTSPDPSQDKRVKSLVKPRYCRGFACPHWPVLEDGYFQVTENKTPFSGQHTPTFSTSKFRLVHYWTRDEEFFEATKLSRTHIIESIKDSRQFYIGQNEVTNMVVDESMKPFSKILRERMKN